MNRGPRKGGSAPPSQPPVAQPSPEERRHRAHERLYWRKQLRVSQCLNILTGAAGSVALIGLAFVYKGVVDNEDATARANRAWIAIDNPQFIRFPNVPGDEMDAYINFVNVGREPASNVKNRNEFFWFTPEFESKNVIEMNKQILPSNNTCTDIKDGGAMGTVWAGKAQPYSGNGVPVRVDIDFFTGRKWYGYHGCFAYETFGKIHHTSYCRIFEANPPLPPAQWRWALCPGAAQEKAD